ncbi:pyruvate dehydrogenase E2 component (dihydrolipoamide acetyltransferase) [Sedimentibacter acidaminivorans]|uniref:Dihydrolipoamide acetyltransferase component of pyruvate dehydrogenase complex n=1 Tax=Sedimentibacter acidaminivorans TaxID=913099 RepID=A0ABS4GDY3_9FIRM|nr:dihydrolipoamide acetyltransferase family protein [Sedimentibacter acidaminivorans]MBP1925913.1 pyruvate dehydrogenase E2 component (dihydrolipoamide acetyltransferase) [Sedimentibacter acidaminivorans]
MATNVIMPQLGLTMEEGTIGKWIKQVGDIVKKGDVIVEITTDKLSTEIESEVDGTLLKIIAQEGEDIPVKGLIAIIGEEGEQIDTQLLKEAPTSEEKEVDNTPKIEEKIQQEMPVSNSGRIKVSPLAKKTAAKIGVDLSTVKGSGPNGRIVQKDVLAAESKSSTESKVVKEEIKQVQAVSADTIIPLTNMRKVIGKRMAQSKQTAPHVTITTEVNVDKTVELRNKLNAKNTDVKFSYTDILVKMTATALRSYPIINSSITDDSIIIHDKVNIGVAVALDDGLIVPVVRDADRKGLKIITKETKDIISKARTNTLSKDEMSDATFTISNLGGYDIDGFTPVINLPESCILGVGRIVRKPIVNENDEIVPASMMVLSMSFDHRVVDGATAAEFLKKLKGYLEDPDNMYV